LARFDFGTDYFVPVHESIGHFPLDDFLGLVAPARCQAFPD
jgi:hypothetical protein